MNELYNLDCVEFMDTCISQGRRFDYCITSPPYNMMLRVRDGIYISRGKNTHEFSNKYENYSDDLTMDQYFEFLDSVIQRLLKLCKLTFFNIQAITGNKVALFNIIGKYSNYIKDIIIWDKVNCQPAMHENMLNSQFEFILIFDCGKPYNRAFDYSGFNRGDESNVWKIKTDRNSFNKASFPEELVARLLDDFTEPNSVIFDPFMGSGTTGIVCHKKNRDFVGCELVYDMFQIAKSRIDNECQKKRLF